jgi:hypothetical protein
MEIHGEISSVETPVDDGLKSSENLNTSTEASLSSSAALENSAAAIDQIQDKKQLSHPEAVWHDFHAIGFLSSNPSQ